MMRSELTYKQIKNQFMDSEWNSESISDCKLSSADYTASVDLIIEQLNSDETPTRYIASSMVVEFQIQKAKNTLIKRILDAETMNSNGTMTFALGHLNCKDKLVDVFRILSTQSYESKCHAYNILSEQEFEFSKDDIEELTSIWTKVNHEKEKHHIFDSETLEMIKDAYEGFRNYLDKPKPRDNRL